MGEPPVSESGKFAYCTLIWTSVVPTSTLYTKTEGESGSVLILASPVFSSEGTLLPMMLMPSTVATTT
jgi:hypothetical protein